MAAERERPSEQQEGVESDRAGGGASGAAVPEESVAPQFTMPGNDALEPDREQDEIAYPEGTQRSGAPEERAMRVENE
ncbi:hypothetical protein SAMN05216266_10665 [Amycolatopsis marina]|uniref:Uncharacterized protein n=1 Tax=Amycolatopsis marina TaxID=490629 RepID=A0A1I0Z415_9PSEU|nr:hypothetical protein [Amycolatopsis marina]SFB19856.1 hypothetical protein SAMN05216266_10665 [Amycolatopsis marina]